MAATTTDTARQPFFAQSTQELTAYRQLLQRQVDLTRDLTVAWTTVVARMSGAALAQSSWATWWQPQQGGLPQQGRPTPEPKLTAVDGERPAAVHPAEQGPDIFDRLIDLLVDSDLSNTLEQRLAG